ncbi:MAG: alkaline phosphatase family protein [Acidobacteria bacterium]|nr:alkaline phosphatase family protein [Acidobacteriota bacterium]
MPVPTRWIAAWLWIALLSPARAAEIPPRDRTVVVISLDGLPARAFDDPKLPVPTLRRLAREGAVAKSMTVVNPAVTWPNHTSMVTGVPPARHGVLFNGMLMRQGPSSPVRVEPWRDKAEMVRAPTVYDLAHQARLTTAQVDWVAIYHARTITWEFPERPSVGGRIEQEMIAGGLVTAAEVEDFAQANVTWRDQVWTRAAGHILEKHKPNLLLFHVLNLDGTHHRYGPGVPAAYSAIAFADSRVAEILRAIETAGLAGKATVFVVSDHGFKATTHNIRPNVALRRGGLLLAQGGIVTCYAYVVPEGGSAMVYVTDPANRARLVPRLKEMFRDVEGVERILEPADFSALGLPDPARYDQMADLVLTAKNGYAFAAGWDGDVVTTTERGGQHGYLSTDPDMDAMFLAWGYGIRPGVQLERVANVDLAPTIAALLGLKMEGVAGKKLSAILR